MGPYDIQLYDPVECPDAELTIFECPKHGTLENLGDGWVTYTPCENYLGADWFSYTLGEGTPAPGPEPGPWPSPSPSPSPSPEPGQGVVEITVEGSCCYYEVFKCGLQPLEPRRCIPKAIVDRLGEVFLIGDDTTCYMADTSCPICPPYNGIVLSDEEEILPVPYGCDELDCFECVSCGDCCFSTASVVLVEWDVGSGSPSGGDAFLQSQLDAVRNGHLKTYFVEDPINVSWQQMLEPLNCYDPDSEPPKNKSLAALGQVQYSCTTNEYSFTLTYSQTGGPSLGIVDWTETLPNECGGVIYDVTRWSFGGQEFDSTGNVTITLDPTYNRCCYNGAKCCKLRPDCDCSMADDGTCIGLVGDCECPSPP